jgi:Cu/Ag efflux protein CusF
MTGTAGLSCAVALLASIGVPVGAQQPAYESTPVTLNATITAIDKDNRVVTLKGPTGNVDVQADAQMQGFNSLKVGDQVSATYYEAVVLRAVRPGAPTSASPPATIVTRKDRAPGSERRREQSFTVTIEEIDMKAPSVRVKGPQGRTRTFMLSDPKQFQSLKAGDTVELTYFESLLVEVTRPKKD